MQHSVEFSSRRAVGWSVVSGKLKVENEHDDQTIFILYWNHIYHTVETHSCRDKETLARIEEGIVTFCFDTHLPSFPLREN